MRRKKEATATSKQASQDSKLWSNIQTLFYVHIHKRSNCMYCNVLLVFFCWICYYVVV